MSLPLISEKNNCLSSPSLKRPHDATVCEIKKSRTIPGFLIEDESDDDELLQIHDLPHKRRSCYPDRDKIRLETENAIFTEPEIGPAALDILAQLSKEKENVANHGITDPLGTSLASGEISTTVEESPHDADATVIIEIKTCSGKAIPIRSRKRTDAVSMEEFLDARSTTKAGQAKKSYYGINLHEIIDEATWEEGDNKPENESDSILLSTEDNISETSSYRSLMWTEKYRAKNFVELIGDNRTHRQILRWLKVWDPIVFPGSRNSKLTPKKSGSIEDEERHHKILLLAGPPGLGKTTMAHVCARQAGYEVVEINASDERNQGVVHNRIKTIVGTESVKTGSIMKSKSRLVKSHAHPICVVVDEVDGVDSGSGDGGFIKALIDLLLLDKRNTSDPVKNNTAYQHKKKRVDNFKLLRPLILICNDVYHPNLRPLRQSNFAEIIHVRNPSLDNVVTRLKFVFKKENIDCDEDAVRRLCELTWEVNSSEAQKGKEGSCHGDLRSILMVGEWAARKLKFLREKNKGSRLTRKWVDQNLASNLTHDGGEGRGGGRGGAREVVKRVFLEGAGFPKTTFKPVSVQHDLPKTLLGVAEQAKKVGMKRLRDEVESNDINRIILEIFSQYPNQPFNDDSVLSKPMAAYEWLHFYDSCSSQVFSGQNFELVPYLSQPVLACHHLFASPARYSRSDGYEAKRPVDDDKQTQNLPFTGPRADYDAFEAEKSNRAIVQALLSDLEAVHRRSFRSPKHISIELLPYLIRMLTPGIKPVIVGGSGGRKPIGSVRKESEKAMVQRAVVLMRNLRVTFEERKMEAGHAGNSVASIYHMEP